MDTPTGPGGIPLVFKMYILEMPSLLCRLFRLCRHLSTFPNFWKYAEVLSSDPDDYRPIFATCYFRAVRNHYLRLIATVSRMRKTTERLPI